MLQRKKSRGGGRRTMKNYLRWIPALCALALCLAAAGCSQPTSQEAEASLCEALSELDQAMQNLESINETATVGELKAAEDQVTEAMKNVETAAADLDSARKAELQTAYDNLENAVRSIPDDATIQEGLASITEERMAFRQAWENMNAEVGCG
jgi:tetratricopeptide (TPR) repeat protein